MEATFGQWCAWGRDRVSAQLDDGRMVTILGYDRNRKRVRVMFDAGTDHERPYSFKAERIAAVFTVDAVVVAA